jgi:hypothetical protein
MNSDCEGDNQSIGYDHPGTKLVGYLIRNLGLKKLGMGHCLSPGIDEGERRVSVPLFVSLKKLLDSETAHLKNLELRESFSETPELNENDHQLSPN